MRILLVHGWGFDARIWDRLLPHLGKAEIARLDLGFLGPRLKRPKDWPADAIAVGHSLGLLWLLHRREPFRALVSVQGFDCFACHVGAAKLAAMQRGLRRDAYGLMQTFWRSCGIEAYAPASALDVKRLGEGLDWLTAWDESRRRKALEQPVLALAAKDDPIVPEAMTRAIWGDTVQWSNDAGHLLPLRHPEWCAGRILKFAHDIDR
jgi:pimeloyl-[acyl-carrier protein] methyl ester esterase